MCPRGEIGNTKDLKPCPLGVPVRVRRGHHCKMIQPLIISDKNSKSLKIKSQIENIKENKFENQIL